MADRTDPPWRIGDVGQAEAGVDEYQAVVCLDQQDVADDGVYCAWAQSATVEVMNFHDVLTSLGHQKHGTPEV
jgi:hypothetical protein